MLIQVLCPRLETQIRAYKRASRKATMIPRSSVQKSAEVTLKQVARLAGCHPSTVSAVLNDSAAARVISSDTKNRVLAAARHLNYHANFAARSLRMKRTYPVGVITEEIGDAYRGLVISGIESFLTSRKYFFTAVAHRHDRDLLQHYSKVPSLTRCGGANCN